MTDLNRRLILWGILWILSLVCISFWGGPVSYGFFAAMTIIPVISWLYLFMVFLMFRIYQKLVSPVMVTREPSPFYFTLVNEFPMIFAGVRVRFFSSFSTISGLNSETEYELRPHSSIKMETQIVCHYRGEYEIGIKRVEIEDYLRLFRLSYKNPDTLRVAVKPHIIYFDSLKTVNVSELLRDSLYHKNTPDILTREYMAGDDVRMINWAQTARSGVPMVREQTGEERQGVSIYLDTYRPEEDERDYLPAENTMLEILLALSWFMVSKGISIKEFHIDRDKRIYPVSDTAHFDDYYEFISAVSFAKEYSPDRAVGVLDTDVSILSSNAVFIITRQLSDPVMKMINTYTHNDTEVLIYLVCETADDAVEALNGVARVTLIPVEVDAEIEEVL